MVSTGSFRTTAATVAPSMATIAPGIRLEMARHSRITATVPAASSVACRDQVGAAAASAFIRSQNSLGTLARCRPKKSLIWVLAIRTAMPLVNPITTGRGINFTAVPIPVAPRMMRIAPAITVHMYKPSMP